MKVTVEDLRKCPRSTSLFVDMDRGGAMHEGDFCGHPRLTWMWLRPTRHANAQFTYFVDGAEVASLAEAAQRLNEPKATA